MSVISAVNLAELVDTKRIAPCHDFSLDAILYSIHVGLAT